MMTKKRKHRSAEEKASLLKKHHLDKSCPRDMAATARDGMEAGVRHLGRDARHFDQLMNLRLGISDLPQAVLAVAAPRREPIVDPCRVQQHPLVTLVTGLPPRARPELVRSGRSARTSGGSDDGGLPELREFSPSLASSSATRLETSDHRVLLRHGLEQAFHPRFESCDPVRVRGHAPSRSRCEPLVDPGRVSVITDHARYPVNAYDQASHTLCESL
jgi:hypothetical protein